MIRGRLWQGRGVSSVCGFCQGKLQVPRPVRRQLYSSASDRSALANGQKPNDSGSATRSSSGWGTGGDDWGSWGSRAREPSAQPIGTGSGASDGLLPHERAARDQAIRSKPTNSQNDPTAGAAQQQAPRPGGASPPRTGLEFQHPSQAPQGEEASASHRRARKPIFNPSASNVSPSDHPIRPRRGEYRMRDGRPHPDSVHTPHRPHGPVRRVAISPSTEEGRRGANEEWSQLRRRSGDPPRLHQERRPEHLTPESFHPATHPSRPKKFWDQARDRLNSSYPPSQVDNREGDSETAPGGDQGGGPPRLGHRFSRHPRSHDRFPPGRRTQPGESQGADSWRSSTRGGTQRGVEGQPGDASVWSPTSEDWDSRRVGAAPGQLDAVASLKPKSGLTDVSPDRRRSARDHLAKEKKTRARPSKSSSHRGYEDDDEDVDYDEDYADDRRRRKAEKKAQKDRKKARALEQAQAGPTPIFLPEFISVSNLAAALGVKQNRFIAQLEVLGFEDINLESIMTGDTAALVAQEYGFEPTVDVGEGQDLKPRAPPDDPLSLPPRPPVVTIMGHVDHGKTTLLDFLRKSSVAASEHGGITQHIGAFSVKLSSGKQITFLDTPGHAAFLTMRQRGANVTDIVILVVAADDSVKPQTIEALKHAQSAKVPIIVAINKVDKEEARVDQVKADLSRHGVEIEDYGGDVQVVCVSGKTGLGMADLEENIITLSEILDMRAETDGMAEGWVLESSVKPIGRVATVLVKRGTLRQGDFIVAGKTWTRIRSLRNEFGADIAEAPPGTPVEILGWKDPPEAGDQILQAPDEGRAKDAVHYRQEQSDRADAVAQMLQQEQARREKEREEALASSENGADGEGATEPEQTGPKIVNFVVKGDVHGSVEAVCGTVLEIGSNEVQPRVLRSAAGHLTESDIDHAATSGSHIINFNTQISGNIKRMAEDMGVNILDHTIIYHLADDVRKTLSNYLTPAIVTRVTGEAEVLQVFSINIKKRVQKNIAGCRIRNGVVNRGGSIKYRVLRGGEKIFEGVLDELKQGKKDATEVRKGAECGISLMDWDDFKQGDQIQGFEEIEEKRYL